METVEKEARNPMRSIVRTLVKKCIIIMPLPALQPPVCTCVQLDPQLGLARIILGLPISVATLLCADVVYIISMGSLEFLFFESDEYVRCTLRFRFSFVHIHVDDYGSGRRFPLPLLSAAPLYFPQLLS